MKRGARTSTGPNKDNSCRARPYHPQVRDGLVKELILVPGHLGPAGSHIRCLWGTDWTRAFAVVNYEQAVEPFLKIDRLSASERAMVMGGATAKAYGWSPKKV